MQHQKQIGSLLSSVQKHHITEALTHSPNCFNTVGNLAYEINYPCHIQIVMSPFTWFKLKVEMLENESFYI